MSEAIVLDIPTIRAVDQLERKSREFLMSIRMCAIRWLAGHLR